MQNSTVFWHKNNEGYLYPLSMPRHRWAFAILIGEWISKACGIVFHVKQTQGSNLKAHMKEKENLIHMVYQNPYYEHTLSDG